MEFLNHIKSFSPDRDLGARCGAMTSRLIFNPVNRACIMCSGHPPFATERSVGRYLVRKGYVDTRGIMVVTALLRRLEER